MKYFNALLFLVLAALLISSPCRAEEPITFKDWFVGSGTGFIYAATMNKSGHLLGQYCYSKDAKCYYMVAFDTVCTPGNNYPVLINTDQGAVSRQIICDSKIESSENYRYYIKYDDINDLILKATKIGFAIPMRSDEFRGIRFSLDGAGDAIAFMLKIANSAPKTAPAPEEKKDSETF